MCYQCVAESKIIKSNIIGDYSLQIAGKSIYDKEDKVIWKAAFYALVLSNDPTVYFNDIVFGYDEKTEEEKYFEECEKIERILNELDFRSSFELSCNIIANSEKREFDTFAGFYIYDIISETLKEIK